MNKRIFFLSMWTSGHMIYSQPPCGKYIEICWLNKKRSWNQKPKSVRSSQPSMSFSNLNIVLARFRQPL